MSEYIYGTDEQQGHWLTGEEIVRCRDCAFFDDEGEFGQWCTQFDFGKKEIANGFCAWGVKRNDGKTPENDVSEDDVDANDANTTQDMDNGICVRMCPNDNREKLEVATQIAAGYIYCRGFMNGLADAWNDDEVDAAVNQITRLLDRQAAITEHELRKQQESLAQRMIVDGYENELFEMRKQISELTAECDEWKAKAEQALTDDESPRGTFQVSHDNGRTFSVPVEILAEPKPPESASESRWHELFGTPERAARTLNEHDTSCRDCLLGAYCDEECLTEEEPKLLEWLRGDA